MNEIVILSLFLILASAGAITRCTCPAGKYTYCSYQTCPTNDYGTINGSCIINKGRVCSVTVQYDPTSNQGQNKNPSCFPQNTIVISKQKGKIKFSQLKINDEILTKQGYSKVIGWLHKDSNLIANYLQIGDQHGSFFVSPLHNLMSNSGYKFAKEFQQIKATVFLKGAYSPMTESGNYYILKSNGQKVLAHAFSFVKNPERFENLARTIMYYFPSGEQTHMICQWFLQREWARNLLTLLQFHWN